MSNRYRVRGAIVVAASCLVAFVACREQIVQPIADRARRADQVLASQCRADCVLIDGVTPLRSAAPLPDSANATLPFANGTATGSLGDSITLRIDADSEVLAAAASEAVIVRVDDTPQAYALSRLAHGVVVYRFDAAKSVRVRYALTRTVTSSVPDGQFRLHQLLSGSATKLFGPWMAGTSAGPEAILSSCAITAQSSTACGVTYTVSPFSAPPTNIGGTWSSPGLVDTLVS